MNVPIIFDFESKGVSKVESQLNKIEKSTDKTQSNISKAYDKVKAIGNQSFNGLKSGLNSAVTSSGNLVEKLGGAKMVAGGIASGIAAAVTALYSASSAADELQRKFKGFGDTTNKRIASGITESISTLGEVDGKMLGQAVKVFANEYKVSKLQALKLIEDAATKGLDLEEGLDQIREYTSQFKKLGYSAEETLGIITKSSLEGWFTDKAADAIKEAGLRLRELPKATSDALKAAGIDVKKMESELASGAMNYDDVIKTVATRMVELGEGSKITGTLIADVFGAPGEDVSFAFFEALSNGVTDLSKLTDQTTAFQKSSMELAYQWSVVKSSISDSSLGTGFNDMLTEILKLTTYTIEVFPAKFGSAWAKIANGIQSTFADVVAFLSKVAFTDSKRQYYRNLYNDLQVQISSRETAARNTLDAATENYNRLTKGNKAATVAKPTNLIGDTNKKVNNIVGATKAAETKANGAGGGVAHQITINIDSMVKQMTITQNDDPKKTATVIEQLLNEAIVNAKQLK